MNHNEIQSSLEAFLDGQLDAPNRREVERHLVDCRSCSDALESLRLMSRAVFRPVRVPNTDHFVSRVMARIRESAPVPEASGIWRWPAIALVAAAAFLLVKTPAESGSPARQACSTGTVLLADAGPDTASRGDDLDRLLDLGSEEI